MILYFSAAMIGMILGALLCKYALPRPIYVHHDHSFLVWSEPVLVCLACIVSSFFFDFVLGLVSVDDLGLYKDSITSTMSNLDWFFYLSSKAVENGFLIPLFVILTSRLVGNIVRKSYLIYLYIYSDYIPKTGFTIMTLLLVARLWRLIEWDDSLENIGFVYVRLFMWVMTVFGTWFSFGFGCEVIFEQEDASENNNTSEKSNVKVLKWFKQIRNKLIFIWNDISKFLTDLKKILKNPEMRSEILPIVVSLLLCLVVLFIPLEGYGHRFLYAFFLFSIVFVITLCFGLCYANKRYNLGLDESIKLFDKVIELHKKNPNKLIKGRFGRMVYHFSEDNFHIDKVDIRYDGNDKVKLHELFDEKNYPLKGNREYVINDNGKIEIDYKKIKNDLIERRNNQKEFIESGIKNSKEMLKNRKLEQIQHMRRL